MDEDLQQNGAEAATEATETPATPEPSFAERMGEAITDSLDDGEPPQPESGQPRGPDGKFLPKTLADGNPADAGQPPPDQQPAPEGKPAEAQKPPEDPYREPEGLKPEASERFRALVAVAKEKDARIGEIEAQYAEVLRTAQAFQALLVESQATDQEFAALLDCSRAVKTGDWRAAEPLLAAQIQQFRLATGRDPAGIDPFEQHPDLSEQVQSGKISVDMAREVVRARQFAAQIERHQADQRQQQQSQQVWQQNAQHATAQVSALVEQWRNADLDWPRKQVLLQEQAREIAETLPPQQWGAALARAYKVIGEAMKAVVPPRTPTPPAQQPLRASGASGGAKQPQTMYEAIFSSADDS